MKRIGILMLFLCAVFTFPLRPVEIVTLKESESIDFLEKMDDNDVFVKRVRVVDIERDAANHYIFYFLDYKLGTVFRIDGNTGKLLNTIASLGQGPGELDTALSMRVRNQMVFVSDHGFGGVKIFKTDGALIKEFRTGKSIYWLDVNEKNEIYVKEADFDAAPIISLYNMDGKRLRKVVRVPVEDMNDKIEFIYTKDFYFRLDSKENLIVLFYLKRIIRKYNQKGDLLWERKVDNELLQEFSRPKKPRYGPGGTVQGNRGVFHMDIDSEDNTIVGHVAGAMVLDKDGEMVRLLKTDPQMNIDFFKIYDNDTKFLRVLVGGWKINIFNYKKGGK